MPSALSQASRVSRESGTELGEHFSFDHVDEDAFGASWASALHALGERFRALAGEASEGVLREVAWHGNSWKRAGVQVFHKKRFPQKARAHLPLFCKCGL